MNLVFSPAAESDLEDYIAHPGSAPVESPRATTFHHADSRPNLVRSLNYVVSVHAAEELEDENLTILDLENILLTGTIVERQKDRETREGKIVIQGRTLDDRQAEAVVKIGFTGVLYVITVYLI